MFSTKVFIIIPVILFLTGKPLRSQTGTGQSYRIAFYNVENFFDIYPDTTLSYNEYTPDGNHHWDKKKYDLKKNRIFKVIAALGGWEGVCIMGFAEIENRSILEDLINNTPLQKENYGIVHFESDDHRGIDVGLIYKKECFKVLQAQKIPLTESGGKRMHTRDILYVKGLLGDDTLHLFVNHWPSRYGGMMKTVPKRKLAARTLKKITDSICRTVEKAEILAMGDFNDNPEDESLQILTDCTDTCNLKAIPYGTGFHLAGGSLKHKAEWAVFDQVLVSDALLNGNSGLKIVNGRFTIFDARFLLEKDDKYEGYTTNRTYRGFTYHGGYSDHLPVYVDIVKQRR